MKQPHPVLLIAAGVSFIVLALLLVQRKDTPLPRAEQKTADSLTMTRPAFDSSVAAERARGDSAATRASQLGLAAQLERQSAERARRAADDLQKMVEVAKARAKAASDSTSAWFTVAQLAQVESDSLRVSNDRYAETVNTLTVAHAADSVQLIAARRETTLERQRRVSVEDYATRLEKDVRRGDGCRIAWVLDCPTRKEAIVGGVVVGGVLVKYGDDIVRVLAKAIKGA